MRRFSIVRGVVVLSFAVLACVVSGSHLWSAQEERRCDPGKCPQEERRCDPGKCPEGVTPEHLPIRRSKV